jgi:hypothetical protein
MGVGLGVKYKLVLVGTSVVVGLWLIVFDIGSVLVVGTGVNVGKSLVTVIGTVVSDTFCCPSTGMTGASDGSSDWDGISDAQNR